MIKPRSLLERLHEAGVLSLGELHVAETLARLARVDCPEVVLATALAARAPRLGHTCVDLTAAVDSIVTEHDERIDGWLEGWPDARRLEPAAWLDAVRASPLVAGEASPLVLEGPRLYLRRYWAYEQLVANQLAERATQACEPVTPATEVLDALLPGEGSDRQRDGVQRALAQPLTVLLGGPGTGKTTTVAALLASLVAHDPTLRIALAAPTGKAAARLAEALSNAATSLPRELAALLKDKEERKEIESSTVHRLLGVPAGSRTQLRHHQRHPLPHDVVIVDETSMVSVPLMAHLLDAVRPESRLVLVGDPGQLASVEAGTVLGDIAGPWAQLDHKRPEVTEQQAATSPLHGHVVVLDRSRRFPTQSPIDRLARAIRAGDCDAALAALDDRGAASAASGALAWITTPGDQAASVNQVLDLALPVAEEVCHRAAKGDAREALAALGKLRILCAHRKGSFGVERWNRHLEAGLARAGHPTVGWYAGRPLLVSANDYANRLFNGDLGVVVTKRTHREVAFADGANVRTLVPSRLHAVETVHAMTIHKSQGSEFDHVIVVLPPAGSPLASRELFYTAVTRARERVTVVGDEAAVRAAIERRVVRMGGLRERLWPAEPASGA